MGRGLERAIREGRERIIRRIDGKVVRAEEVRKVR